MGRFAPTFRPGDVHIAELFGALSDLDAGVTTALDLSQIHHGPEHTDAAIRAIGESGQRVAFGHSESQANKRFVDEAGRIRRQYCASTDQLMTMVIGAELVPPGGCERAAQVARDLDLPLASHVVPSMQKTLAKLPSEGRLGRNNLLIHMTGVDDASWKTVADSPAGVSVSVPIEMTMRHGMPARMKMLSLGMEPSPSSDVECTMAADSFTQMRSALTLQRLLANEAALAGGAEAPKLATARDVIRWATLRGARHLWLGHKVGSLTPGKEADIVVLDASAVNVAPLNNVPGAFDNAGRDIHQVVQRDAIARGRSVGPRLFVPVNSVLGPPHAGNVADGSEGPPTALSNRAGDAACPRRDRRRGDYINIRRGLTRPALSCAGARVRSR